MAAPVDPKAAKRLNWKGSAMPGIAEGLVIFLIVIPLAILGVLMTVIPFWKICAKAGFPGALSLLMLVPVANIILPFYIAFADWPALRQTAREPGLHP
jgi:hypothetical protein